MAERRGSKILPVNLYIYLERGNADYVRTHGKRVFGSGSSYINALIAMDRGVTPSLGQWRSPGEATAERIKSLNRSKLRSKKKIKASLKEQAKKRVRALA